MKAVVVTNQTAGLAGLKLTERPITGIHRSVWLAAIFTQHASSCVSTPVKHGVHQGNIR